MIQIKKKKVFLCAKVTERENCQSLSAALTGFLLMAPPTARTALGFPAISASRLYETVSPNFTSLRSVCRTRLVKASTTRHRTHRRGEKERALHLINQSQAADGGARDNLLGCLKTPFTLWKKTSVLGFNQRLGTSPESSLLHNKWWNKWHAWLLHLWHSCFLIRGTWT